MNCYFNNGSDTCRACDIEFISVGAYIRQSHPCAEAHFSHLARGSRITFLHCKFYVGYTRSLINKTHIYIIGRELNEYCSSVGMSNYIDLSFIETYHHSLDDIAVNVKLFQHLFHLARSITGTGEVAALYFIFKIHHCLTLRIVV
jgi:hypothetical protein